jgi:hypothetical protein
MIKAMVRKSYSPFQTLFCILRRHNNRKKMMAYSLDIQPKKTGITAINNRSDYNYHYN